MSKKIVLLGFLLFLAACTSTTLVESQEGLVQHLAGQCTQGDQQACVDYQAENERLQGMYK